MSTQRIAIVGAGSVGATLAYQLSVQGLVPEIWLIDANPAKAEAEALDIAQGTPLGNTVRVQAGGYEGCREAGIRLSRNHPGDFQPRGRADLAGPGGEPPAGLPGHRSGRHCRVSPQNVHAYVLGEHGDTSVPAWSMLSIAGVRLVDFCPACGHNCRMLLVKEEARRYVREAAAAIIKAKGSTYYAIAQAVSVLIRAIVHDERRVLPVSTVHGQYGEVQDAAFSLPTLIGAGGAEQILEVTLTAEESAELADSARFVAGAIGSVRRKS